MVFCDHWHYWLRMIIRKWQPVHRDFLLLWTKFRAMTFRTWRERICLIIEEEALSAFEADIDSGSWFFSCRGHAESPLCFYKRVCHVSGYFLFFLNVTGNCKLLGFVLYVLSRM